MYAIFPNCNLLFQTYTANILTVVNPYRDLSALYTDALMNEYKGSSLGKLDPHTFAIGKCEEQFQLRDTRLLFYESLIF